MNNILTGRRRSLQKIKCFSPLYMLKESVQAQTHTQDDSICAKLIFGTNSIF